MRARLLFFAALCALVTVALACLPDLIVPDAGADADAAPAIACGDGIVDLDAEACDPGSNDGGMGCTSACAIACEGGAIDPQTGHCYFWTDPVDSIDLAQLQCGVGGGHLVSFVDSNELQLVVSTTKSLPGAPDSGGGTWVALSKGTLNDAGVQTYYVPTGVGIELPGWSASCPGCFAIADGGDADFPLAGVNPQFCVFWKRSTTSSWVQQVCSFGGTTTVAALCEREPLGAFSSPCKDDAAAGSTCIVVPRTAATKRYELTATAASFDNARAGCASRGGALVRFESSAEREEVIAEVARQLAGGDVWIGLLFDDEAGAWSWVDGTPAPTSFPTPWGDGEPSINSGAATIHLELGRYDTRLARAQSDTTATFRAICQFTN